MLTSHTKRGRVIAVPSHSSRSPSSTNPYYHNLSSPLHPRTEATRPHYRPQDSQHSFTYCSLVTFKPCILPWVETSTTQPAFAPFWADVSHSLSGSPKLQSDNALSPHSFSDILIAQSLSPLLPSGNKSLGQLTFWSPWHSPGLACRYLGDNSSLMGPSIA